MLTRRDMPLSYNFLLLMELASRGPSFSNELVGRLSGVLGFDTNDSTTCRSLRRLEKRGLIEEIEDPNIDDRPPGKPRVVYQVTEAGVSLLYDQESAVRDILSRVEEEDANDRTDE